MATHHNTPRAQDAPTFTVTVDFAAGNVTGFTPLAEAIVEFIQEDRVTVDDDLAMVMAEALSSYLINGDVSMPEATTLLEALNARLR